MFENKNLVGPRYSLRPGEIGSCFGKTCAEWTVRPVLAKGEAPAAKARGPAWFLRAPRSVSSPLMWVRILAEGEGRAMPLLPGLQIMGAKEERKGQHPKRGLLQWGHRAAGKCRFLACVSRFVIH